MYRKLSRFIIASQFAKIADDLHDYFGKFGKISYASVKTDPATGRSKGFGFVVFADPSAVDEVTQLDFNAEMGENMGHTTNGIVAYC